MNFLAHIYLSLDNDFLKIGNFIADSVRGKSYLDYPIPIQKGILLHREIDEFTDFHPIWRTSKRIVVPRYNHYAAVLIDMYYDHFLALNWDVYHTTPLETYANDFYQLLEQNFDVLPTRVQNFLPIMIRENWLLKYKTIDGLKYILTQMDRRTKGISQMSYATEELVDNYDIFQQQFTAFFEELQQHITEYAIQVNLTTK
ncbi:MULTISPECIES: ACP phosphodiesterase [Myroides]|uniref:DUF479 domain-containing protein n=1 Tax=Myroides albus TaxID=2562892 RepID=A0A6I3LM43_9FLAO|nr:MULTISPECIES: acyl carrier protein phosphodiesterase [Myroides]MTG98576.1 DUF479 domain-containing protein [Myroides albus]MVX36613.1 DUF479 domain-containing protein [Myroides sp. LoEW2-1]UVD79943.1 acyl carrier protein phosphodiesterase [Myroides albus]